MGVRCLHLTSRLWDWRVILISMCILSERYVGKVKQVEVKLKVIYRLLIRNPVKSMSKVHESMGRYPCEEGLKASKRVQIRSKMSKKHPKWVNLSENEV